MILQEVANNLARLTLEAVTRLAGLRCKSNLLPFVHLLTKFALVKGAEEVTPENRNIQNIMGALLTPYVSKLFSRVTVNEVLGLVPHYLR